MALPLPRAGVRGVNPARPPLVPPGGLQAEARAGAAARAALLTLARPPVAVRLRWVGGGGGRLGARGRRPALLLRAWDGLPLVLDTPEVPAGRSRRGQQLIAPRVEAGNFKG